MEETMEKLKKILSPEQHKLIDDYFQKRKIDLAAAEKNPSHYLNVKKKYDKMFFRLRDELNKAKHVRTAHIETENELPIKQDALAAVKNLGNTCYMNSVLFYSLRFVPMFTLGIHELVNKTVELNDQVINRVDILSPEYEMLRILHHTFRLLTRIEVHNLEMFDRTFAARVHEPFEPRAFISSLRRLNSMYIENGQEDAHEFLTDILDWLHKCTDKLIDVSASEGLEEAAEIATFCRGFLYNYFVGTVATSIECSECKTNNEQRTALSFVSVRVPKDIPNDEQLICRWISQELLKVERLEGENTYNCEVCARATVANRRVSYPSLPQILIVQLERFVATQNQLQKVTQFAPTPLHMDCFCHSCQSLDVPNEQHKYLLNAVVIHVGNQLNHGHYIAFVRLLTPVPGQSTCCGVKLNPFAYDSTNSRDTWFKCDDHRIDVMNQGEFQEFLAKNERYTPYLLFYARNDLITKHKNFKRNFESDLFDQY